VEEIVAVMRQTTDDRHGWRLRALIVVLWRGGLRVQEALTRASSTWTQGAGRCSCATARAAGGARSAWTPGLGTAVALARRARRAAGRPAVLHQRRAHPGPRVVERVELRQLAMQANVRRRFAPHQLRHAHAVELAREGVPLNVIQRQLGHANLGTTSIYLQGIDTEEIIATVHARRAPMMSATAGLQL
jgi:integrase/recombinase XerD